MQKYDKSNFGLKIRDVPTIGSWGKAMPQSNSVAAGDLLQKANSRMCTEDVFGSKFGDIPNIHLKNNLKIVKELVSKFHLCQVSGL